MMAISVRYRRIKGEGKDIDDFARSSAALNKVPTSAKPIIMIGLGVHVTIPFKIFGEVLRQLYSTCGGIQDAQILRFVDRSVCRMRERATVSLSS
jgi:hypothetical protein